MREHSGEAVACARHLYWHAQSAWLAVAGRGPRAAPVAWPVPFARGRCGRPLLRLAADAGVAPPAAASLTIVRDDAACPRESLTLSGTLCAVPAAERDECLQRYGRRFRDDEDVALVDDAVLLRLEPERLALSGRARGADGLDPREVCRPSPLSAAAEADILSLMNRRHAATMRCFCRMAAVEPGSHTPALAAIDGDGFDLRLGRHLVRIDFDRPAACADDVRRALTLLAMQAHDAGLHAA